MKRTDKPPQGPTTGDSPGPATCPCGGVLWPDGCRGNHGPVAEPPADDFLGEWEKRVAIAAANWTYEPGEQIRLILSDFAAAVLKRPRPAPAGPPAASPRAEAAPGPHKISSESEQFPRQVEGPSAAVPGAAPASLEEKPAISTAGAGPTTGDGRPYVASDDGVLRAAPPHGPSPGPACAEVQHVDGKPCKRPDCPLTLGAALAKAVSVLMEQDRKPIYERLLAAADLFARAIDRHVSSLVGERDAWKDNADMWLTAAMRQSEQTTKLAREVSRLTQKLKRVRAERDRAERAFIAMGGDVGRNPDGSPYYGIPGGPVAASPTGDAGGAGEGGER